MDKIGFLNDLLKLWREYGEIAKDLIPLIRRVATEIAAESAKPGETDTEQARRILEMTKLEKTELDELLASDLASLE